MNNITKIDTSPLVVCTAAWIQCGRPKTGSCRLLKIFIKNDPTLLERAKQFAIDTVDIDESSYKTKYGESFEKSIKAVEGGDLKRALRLIEWSKFFLSVRSIAKIIITAEILCDTNTLDKISKAANKIRKQKPNEHWFVLGILKCIASSDIHPTRANIVRNAIRFGEELSQLGWPASDPALNLLSDETAIYNFLKSYWHLISVGCRFTRVKRLGLFQ